MKNQFKHFIFWCAASCIIGSCNKSPVESPDTNTSMERQVNKEIFRTENTLTHWVDYTTANISIESYLASIDTFNTDQISSFYIDADNLRDYLSDNNIVEIKVMIGHTDNVISNPIDSQYHYLNAGSNTLFLAGIDVNNNYILYDNDYVLNRLHACPLNCKLTGEAASPLLSP